MIGALIIIALCFGIFYFISYEFQDTPSNSVSSKETPNAEPAGPADADALPGNR
jgi:hypothetical protein